MIQHYLLSNFRIKYCLFLFSVAFFQLLSNPILASVQVPILDWPGQRSDWINVKTDVTPQAKGDGFSDDTQAIQAAFNLISASDPDGKPKTVYFPPGTYRITQTLSLTSGNGGCRLVGHGRLTTIFWDGGSSTMVLLDGAPRSLFEGIIFDGNNKATTGLDHYSSSLFVTETDHKYLGFKNLQTGIRFGNNIQASAEQSVQNCLFENCTTGIFIQTFNNYDILMVGSDFYNCGTGIKINAGSNAYVRDCHFENSTVSDVLAIGPEHPCSFIRCTSLNSKKFLDWSGNISTAFVQDCRVSGWKANDAITLASGAPVTIFDCNFTNPPTTAAPINSAAPLVVSNNTSTGTTLVYTSAASVTVIPNGKRTGAVKSATQSFFQETRCVPQKVYDVKFFGAKGDAYTDDRAAIQTAIDSAKKYGRGAIAYIPRGDYKVNGSLVISGSNYVVGGVVAGASRIFWGGAAGGIIVKVLDPKNVTIEQVGFLGTTDSLEIQQSGIDTSSSIYYDNVAVYGMYQQNSKKGLQFLNLPKGASVSANHLNGNVRATNSSRAKILINFHWEGTLTVEGAVETIRDGFIGLQAKLSTNAPYGIHIKDNQNLIVTNYYMEQADQYLLIEGNNSNINGHATIAGIKVNTNKNPAIEINNYKGRIACVSLQYYQGIDPKEITQTGTQPLNLLMIGNTGFSPKINFNTTPAASLVLLQNKWIGKADTIPLVGLQVAADAFDDFRELGQYDLAMNFTDNCEINVGLAPVSNYSENVIQIYPNPSGTYTNVNYKLAETSTVKIEMEDLLGKKIMGNVIEKQLTGEHEFILQNENLTAGIYLIKITINENSFTKKLVINQ